MKCLLAIVGLVLMASVVQAGDVWVFGFRTNDMSVKAKDYGPVPDTAPKYKVGMILMHVTEAQHSAGWGAVTQQMKDDAIVAAKFDRADLLKWSPERKAFAKVLRDNDERWRKVFRQLVKDIPAVSNSLVTAGVTANDLKSRSIVDWIDDIDDKM